MTQKTYSFKDVQGKVINTTFAFGVSAAQPITLSFDYYDIGHVRWHVEAKGTRIQVTEEESTIAPKV
jgi:hypothetical protein